jgi:hypothetical protein
MRLGSSLQARVTIVANVAFVIFLYTFSFSKDFLINAIIFALKTEYKACTSVMFITVCFVLVTRNG